MKSYILDGNLKVVYLSNQFLKLYYMCVLYYKPVAKIKKKKKLEHKLFRRINYITTQNNAKKIQKPE